MNLFVFSKYDVFSIDIRKVLAVGYVLSSEDKGTEVTIRYMPSLEIDFSIQVPHEKTIVASAKEAQAFNDALSLQYQIGFSVEPIVKAPIPTYIEIDEND